jgi:hypothetical protein
MMIRRGTTIVELIVASAMLGTLLVICLQMAGALAAQQRTVQQRQLATLELANLMERIAARPWADVTPQAVAAEQPTPAARNRLPDAEVKVEVTTPAAEPDAKRIAASIRWKDRSGGFLPPVTLTTWKYQ